MCFAFAVQTFKHCPRHQYLATNFELCRKIAVQLQRYAANGAYIGCNIVAANAVAACNGLLQSAIFVYQRDGCAVVFEFANHFERFAQTATDALVPIGYIAGRVGVGQRQHRIAVRHLYKSGIQVAADTLRGRVRIEKLGMRTLQLLQFAQFGIELKVADSRTVEHIIIVVVPIQFVAQLCYLLLWRHKKIPAKNVQFFKFTKVAFFCRFFRFFSKKLSTMNEKSYLCIVFAICYRP